MKIENLSPLGKNKENIDTIVKEVVVDELKKRYDGNGYSYERIGKTPASDGQSLSDYGTLKGKFATQMPFNISLRTSKTKQRETSTNGTLFTPPSKNRDDNGHVGPYLLTGSNRSSPDAQETSVNVPDELFYMANDNPAENQKNYDTTLRIGEEKKKY